MRCKLHADVKCRLIAVILLHLQGLIKDDVGLITIKKGCLLSRAFHPNGLIAFDEGFAISEIIRDLSFPDTKRPVAIALVNELWWKIKQPCQSAAINDPPLIQQFINKYTDTAVSLRICKRVRD